MSFFVAAAEIASWWSGLTALQATLVVMTASSFVIQQKMAYDARKAASAAQAEAARRAEEAKGFQLVTEGEPVAIPIVYGRNLIGGSRVYHKTFDNYRYAAPAVGGLEFWTNQTAATIPLPQDNGNIRYAFTAYPSTLDASPTLQVVYTTNTNLPGSVTFGGPGDPSCLSAVPVSINGDAPGVEVYTKAAPIKTQPGDSLFVVKGTYIAAGPFGVNYVLWDPPVLSDSNVGTWAKDGVDLNADANGEKHEYLLTQQALCFGGTDGINGIYAVTLDGKRLEGEYSNAVNDIIEKSTITPADLNEDGSIIKDSPSDIAGIVFNHPFKNSAVVHAYLKGGVADPLAVRHDNSRSTALFTPTAYLSGVFKLNRDDPQFSGGVPKTQVYLEGLKLAKIERFGFGGVNGYGYTLNETKEYSNSPPLCLLDYLLSPVYGRGLSVDQIDLESFYEADRVCKRIVRGALPLEGIIWRAKDVARDLNLYECNISLSSSKTIRENIEAILATMNNADLIWSAGKYKLVLKYPYEYATGGGFHFRWRGQDVIFQREFMEGELVQFEEGGRLKLFKSLVDENATVPTLGANWSDAVAAYITDDNIIREGETSITWPDAQTRLNFATVKFLNESKDFAEDTVSWPNKLTNSVVYETFLAEDSNVPMETEVFLTGITSYFHALAKAEYLVRASRFKVNYEISVEKLQLRIEPGDILDVQSDVLRLNDLVIVKEVRPDIKGFIRLSAERFDARYLSWNVGDDELVEPRVLYPNTLKQATNLFFTTNSNDPKKAGTLSWDNSSDARVEGYYIKVAPLGATQSSNRWQTILTVPQNAYTTTSSCELEYSSAKQFVVAVVAFNSTRVAPQASWPLLDVDTGLAQVELASIVFDDGDTSQGFTKGLLSWGNPDDPRIDSYNLYTTANLPLTASTVWQHRATVNITRESATTSIVVPPLEAAEYKVAIASASGRQEAVKRNWPIFLMTLTGNAPGTVPELLLSAPDRIFITPIGSDTPAPASITVTATSNNMTNVSYVWEVDGVIQVGEVLNTFVLDSFPSTALKTVKCTVSGDGNDEAWDEMSFFSLKEGSDAIMAGLDNQNQSVSCEPDGTPKAGALPLGAQAQVRLGIQDITLEPFVAFSIPAQAGFNGTAAVSPTGAFQATEMTAEFARATILVTTTIGARVVEIPLLFTANKTADGASNTAPSVKLEMPQGRIFVTPRNSATPAPASLTFTAVVKNIVAPVYKWYVDNVIVAGQTTNSLVVNSFAANLPNKAIKVVVEGGAADVEDTETVYSLKEGDDALNGGLINSSRHVNCNLDGTPKAIGSGLPIEDQFEVTRGATFITAGHNVAYSLVSQFGLGGTAAINAVSGAISITDITEDNAYAVFRATVPDPVGGVIDRKLYVSRVRDGGSGSPISLQQRGIAFVFDNATSTNSNNDDIQITAVLNGIEGVPTWTASAFDSTRALISAGVHLSGTDLIKTLSPEQFTEFGGVTVKYVTVAASLNGFSDSIIVYRVDMGSSAYGTRLTNVAHIVPSTALGVVTSYANCGGVIEAYKGIERLSTVTTPSVLFSLMPGGNTDNLGYTINAVTGAYAVTSMPDEIDTTVLGLRATISDGTTLDELFSVTKAKEGVAGLTFYFEPLSEFVLEANADGTIKSFADAWTDCKVSDGTVDVTSEWTITKEDVNCISTKIGDRITLTALTNLAGTLAYDSLDIGGVATKTPIILNGHCYLVYTDGRLFSGPSFDSVSEVFFPVQMFNKLYSVAGSSLIVSGALTAIPANNYVHYYSANNGATWTACAGLNANNVVGSVNSNGVGNIALDGVIYKSVNNGANWTAVTHPAAGALTLYSFNSAVFGLQGSSLYCSTNNGTSWTNISAQFALSNAITMRDLYNAGTACFARLLDNTRATGFDRIFKTTNGNDWVEIPADLVGFSEPQATADKYVFVAENSQVYELLSSNTWSYLGRAPSGFIPVASQGSVSTQLIGILNTPDPADSQLALVSTTAIAASRAKINVLFEKANSISQMKTIPIRIGAVSAIRTFNAYPGQVFLPSTSDGAVTSFAGGTVTAGAQLNGEDDTSNWTWSWRTSDTRLTPVEGNTNVAVITGMSNDLDSATIDFVAKRANFQNVTGSIPVSKIKGSDTSGIKIGSAFAAFSANSTFIGLKFLSNGRFQIRQGANAYQNAGYWAYPESAAYAATSFLWVDATGTALTSGTTGQWLAMTTDREYTLSSVTPGSYLTNLQVMFSQPVAGQNAVLASGALKLVVPVPAGTVSLQHSFDATIAPAGFDSDVCSLDPVIKKFGANGLEVAAAGSLFKSPMGAGLQLGTGDFSFGVFYRWTTVGGNITFFQIGDATGSNTNQLTCGVSLDSAASSIYIMRDDSGLSAHDMGIAVGAANVFHYLCVSRVAGVYHVAVDGVEGTPYTNAGATSSPSTDTAYFCVGNDDVTYFDDIWLVKGDAQYPARVAVPVAPFTY